MPFFTKLFSRALARPRKLAILVPYRHRPTHLKIFLTHMANYFAALDHPPEFSLHIIEQQGEAPFNAGKLKNCGYDLTHATVDYVCFHDVDLLPIQASYSYGSQPARLAWHGLPIQEDWEHYFGGVVLFNKKSFEAVNGFPNCYWGWGPEDLELGIRCNIKGMGFERRDGTYRALPHPHAGFASPQVYTSEAQATHDLFETRRDHLEALLPLDGLSNLSYRLLAREPIILNGKQLPHTFYYLVDIA